MRGAAGPEGTGGTGRGEPGSGELEATGRAIESQTSTGSADAAASLMFRTGMIAIAVIGKNRARVAA
jgi:hypothetical protein